MIKKIGKFILKGILYLTLFLILLSITIGLALSIVFIVDSYERAHRTPRVFIGEWEDIASDVNSTHYETTEKEIARRCTEACNGTYTYNCNCNWCYCYCGTGKQWGNC